MEIKKINIGDTYGFNNHNHVNFFVYKKFSVNSFEIIVVSKNKYTKIEKQKRLIFSYSFSIEQINNFYNKSIVLIEKKPWRIG
jgi:hypothetical protein